MQQIQTMTSPAVVPRDWSAPSVLVINPGQDEPALVDYLAENCAVVLECSDTDQDSAAASLSMVDVVVLIASLPDERLAPMMARIRAHPPFIIVMAKADDVIDRVVALELGADELVDRTCQPRELLARIHALLRRRERHLAASPRAASVEEWKLNETTRMLHTPTGARHSLSGDMMDLLTLLMDQPDGIVTGATAAEILGGTPEKSNAKLRMTVSRLRRRLGQDCPVSNVRGLGYKLDVDVARARGRSV